MKSRRSFANACTFCRCAVTPPFPAAAPEAGRKFHILADLPTSMQACANKQKHFNNTYTEVVCMLTNAPLKPGGGRLGCSNTQPQACHVDTVQVLPHWLARRPRFRL
eukprot:1157871-Pelagomonas_calceolata.AAC.4